MSTHVGRSWTGTFIENACPCPKEPCGLVDTAKVDPKCDQHTALKSMRQGHPSDRCPAVTTDWTPDSSPAAQRWRETSTEYEREAAEVIRLTLEERYRKQIEAMRQTIEAFPDAHPAANLAHARAERDTLRKQIEELTRERDEARAEITEIKNNRLVSAIFGHRKGAPKPFCLYRRQDVSGVSGTGVVAVGCEFPDGLVVLRWTSAWPTSVVFHERGIESVKAIHGHDGRTEVVWLSDEFESLAEMEQRLELVEAHRDSLLVLETAAREELVALRAFFDVWHNRIATYDPGDVLTVDGVRVHNIASLLTVDDSRMLDDFADRVLATQAAVDSLPPKPDTPEDDRG